MQCDITVKAKPAARPKKKKNTSGKSKTVTVRAPIATQTSYKPSAPAISRGGTSVRIRHRELIGNVVGSVPFAVVTTLFMNPGLSSTFPWLSSQARGWEMFRFNSLRLKYMTRTSTSTVGSILMSADYDSADQPPLTEQTQATYMGTVEFAPWKDSTMQFNMAAMNRTLDRHYLRYDAALPTGVDIKTYDPAVVYISAVDFAATGTAAGKLWVEYDVTLYTPQFVAPPATSTTAKTNPASSPSPTAPFGAMPLLDGNQIANIGPGPAGQGPFPINLQNLITGVEYALNFNLQNAAGLGGSGLTSVGPATANLVQSVLNGTQTGLSTIYTFVAQGPSQQFSYATGNPSATFGTGSSILLSALRASSVV